MSDTQLEEELTEEQKAHIAVLRRKFFRFVSILSVFGTVILLIVLRFTTFNYKNVDDYAQYVDHKDKFMRFNAAKALGNFKGDPKATKILITMLGDPAREVRWHAAASLSKLKDPKSVTSLIQAMNNEKDASARSIDIYALGQIGDSRAIKPMEELLYKKDKNSDEKDIRITQLSVIQALASYKQTQTDQILKDFESDKNTPPELKDASIKMRTSKGAVD